MLFSSIEDQSNFSNGLFQGAGTYIDDHRNGFLMASVSGRIFTISLIDFSVRDLTIPGNPSDAFAPHAWFQQAESTTVVQNKIDAPFLWNGISARRSDVNTEVPVGGPMAYGGGRLWVAQGNLFYGGDLAYSHTPPSRDDVIGFTENTYLNEGGAFAVERMITGMIFGQNIDSTLGVKDLLIFEEETVHAFDAPSDRATWKDLQRPIERFALLGQGSLSHEGIVNLNSDTIFRSLTGINSFKYARSAFSDWGNTPISRQVTRGLAYDTQQHLNKTSAVNFENRMLMTTLPELINGHGMIHHGLAVLDYDLVSGMGRKLNPAWEGVWTGLKILKLITITHKSSKRCFIFALSDDSKIELWEVTKEARFDVGTSLSDTRIKWVLESKSFTFGRPRAMKRLESSETWYNQLTGQIDATFRFRSNLSDCWTPWATQTDCAKYKDCSTAIEGCNVVRYLRSQSRGRLGLPIPPDVVDPQSGRYTNQGYEHQVRIELEGYAVLNRLMLTCNLTGDMSVPDIRGVGCIDVPAVACKTGDCVELECCDPDDFTYHVSAPNSVLGYITGRVYLKSNGQPDTGLNGITIRLFADTNVDGIPDGMALKTTSTSGNGMYSFSSLNPGSYVVVATTPTGYLLITDVDSTVDNPLTPVDVPNVVTSDGMIPVTLAPGESDSGNDFYVRNTQGYVQIDGLGMSVLVMDSLTVPSNVQYVQIDGLGMAAIGEQTSPAVEIEGLSYSVTGQQTDLAVEIEGLALSVTGQQTSLEVQLDGLALSPIGAETTLALQLDGLAMSVIAMEDPPAPPAPASILLDTYPTAAAAFSVRKLRTAYAGSCLRIRRSSDNTELDVGFSGNDFDSSAAATFCSGTDGFVSKWYDQSGNVNHLVMATSANQPKLVTAGVVGTVGGKALLTFGTSIRMDLTTNLSGAPSWTMETVWTRNSTADMSMLTVKTTGIPAVRYGTDFYLYVGTDGFYSRYDATLPLRAIASFVATASLQKAFLNAAQLTPALSNSALAGGPNFECLGHNTVSTSHMGGIQEVVFWSSDKSSDALSINSNANAYFAIF